MEGYLRDMEAKNGGNLSDIQMHSQNNNKLEKEVGELNYILQQKSREI
jgi:hypothetical protein